MRRFTPTAAPSARPDDTDPSRRPTTTYTGTSTNNVNPSATRYAGALTAVAVVALAVATTAPIVVTVVGLICFGILHNVLELRYVLGRFGQLLSGRVAVLLVGLVTGIVVFRLSATYLGSAAIVAEILVGYAVLAAGACLGMRGWRLGTAAVVLAVGTILSLTHPTYHFVVLAHLHNLVPLVFLWDWSRRLTGQARTVFRAVQVSWVCLIPALVLVGGLDRWITADPGVVEPLVGDGARVIAATAWPAVPEHALRWLVAFAFLQTMHYIVWVWFLPRAAPEVVKDFETRWPALRNGRLWALGLVLAGLLAVLLATDYGQGRTVYSALASYHAYLEFPIVLAMISQSGGARS